MDQDISILIVDDELPIRLLMSVLLKDFGTIELAESGKEALEKINASKFDLIILDVQMPEMTGYEVCKTIKENEKTSSIPVVFLTANSSNEDEERGLDLGATDFIRKPISPKVVKSRVANILEYQKVLRQLELIALTDPLTGAFNRRQFGIVGDKELSRARRYDTALTIFMLDIDHFKAVNDTHGHDIGDKAIIQTVSVVSNTVREEDEVFRIGGEEFVVILPSTTKTISLDVAERIRIAISEIVIQTAGEPLSFTTSIGVAELTKDDEDINAVLKRADLALYQAKKSGRNRVV